MFSFAARGTAARRTATGRTAERGPVLRRVAGVLAGAALAAGAAAGPAAAATTRPAGRTAVRTAAAGPASTATAGVGATHAFYCNGLPNGCLDDYASFVGAPAAMTMSFFPGGTWADLEGQPWWLSAWGASPMRTKLLITIPMVPAAGATVAAGATGGYDGHWAATARNLIAHGMGGARLRIGHEFNGSWSAWSAKSDPAAFAAYYRHIVTAMRSVPGAAFRFDWNVAAGNYNWDATTAYPGDGYVDTVGEDVYDVDWGQPTATPTQRWNHIVTPGGTYGQGLAFWAAFAAAHHKQLSFAEWGLTNTDAAMANHGGGGDDPTFVTAMHTWITTHDTAFDDYFDRNAADGSHDLTLFPTARATYKQLFTPTTTPVTTPAPAPTPVTTPAPATPVSAPAPAMATLMVSNGAGHAGASRLNYATVHGTVHVFAAVTNPADVVGVTLSLDGTAQPQASLDTAGLGLGKHHVTAVVTRLDHSTVTTTAGFTVR